MTIISRDPFARTELHRRIVRNPNINCSWCGNSRKDGSLFQYYTETDAGREHVHDGLFCSKNCHDSYNEL